ncbi:MAG: cupin domain-containing protein [Planctomycetaceae bacterium]
MIDNLFENVPTSIPTELIQVLAANHHGRIERIVSCGHASPDGFWYDQEEHEWVIVLQGAARLQFEDMTVDLKPGDFVNIPAHKKHRVEWTTPDEPTIWLAVFFSSVRDEVPTLEARGVN